MRRQQPGGGRLFLVFILVVLRAPLAPCAVPPAELGALSDLYFATGGNASWIRTRGWRTLDDGGGGPTDPCEGYWFGVTCDEAKGHVLGLQLTEPEGYLGNGLDGYLPESIANLTQIKVGARGWGMG